MSISGQLDLPNKTFDIFGIPETQAIITMTPCNITLSYLSDGVLVQFRKTLENNPLSIQIGSNLISSGIQDELGAGFLEPTTASGQNVVAKSLAHADFSVASSLGNFQQKTFIDQHGTQRVAILLPVTLV
jgi:hypothetical protein